MDEYIGFDINNYGYVFGNGYGYGTLYSRGDGFYEQDSDFDIVLGNAISHADYEYYRYR